MSETVLNIKTKVDVQNANAAVDGTNEKIEKTSEATTDLTNKLDEMTNGAISFGKEIVSGVKKGVAAMTTLRGAVIATGLGALVVAVGSLVSYFTSTERGAEKLRVVMAALGGIFGAINDRLVKFGETLVSAISNPRQALEDFVGAIRHYFVEFIPNTIKRVIDSFGMLGTAIKTLDFDLAKKGMVELVDSVTDLNPATYIVKQLAKEVIEVSKNAIEASKGAIALETAMNKLIRLERDLAVDRARNNVLIEQQKLASEDVTKTLEERIAATEKAAALEQDILSREIAAQQERVRIIAAQNNLSESKAEDLQRLADAEIRLAELQAASLPKQIELQNRLNSLRAEDQAKRLELAEKERQDRILQLENQMILEKEFGENRLVELQRILDAQMELELAATDLTEAQKDAIRISYMQKKKALDVKAAKEDVQLAEKVENTKLGTIGKAFGDVAALAGRNEKLQKGLAVSAAIANTGQAITATLASQAANPTSILFPGWPFVQAGIIGAAGAAQVANILKGGSQVSNVSSGSSAAPPTQSLNQNLPNFDFINQGVGGSDTAFNNRAFVVNQDIRDQTSLSQRIDDLRRA